MEGPDDSVIAALKSKLPGRQLRAVVMTVEEEDFHFVMSCPNREEYKKFTSDMASADKDLDKLSAAVERAALAQIRWPDREDVKALFDAKPGLSQNFAGELTKAAGVQAEVKSKNL